MLRLAGILTGSALAVAFLLFALGLPRLAPDEESTAASTTSAVTEAPPAEPVAADEATPAPASASDPEPAELSDPGVKPENGPIASELPSDLDSMTAARTEALIDEIFSAAPDPQVPGIDETRTVNDEHWYAFWSPFRSEIAATGFVSRLQETTGIDYRVVKIKTGVYEVAFAYTDDRDIQDKLARISNATGLDMSGG